MARAATAGELVRFRSPGQWSRLRAAVYHPNVVYTARVNQTFVSTDGILEITYDTGSGTLADVLPDMTMLVGSSAGAHDVGICRIRDKDVIKFYIGETSDIDWANDLFLTVIDAFELWARHVFIDDDVPYMDGGIAYSDQHTNFDPIPRMGGTRVLKMTGASVSTTYDFSPSGLIDGSAISAYATTSPTASGGSDLATTTPTLEWDTVGWHLVYLTLTAANGKQYFGVRYVYIWDDDNQPAYASIGEATQDVDTGGWRYSITLFDNVTLADVRDHALVVLFAEDYYDSDTNQQIGSLSGCENVECEGWISGEHIVMFPDRGAVNFTIYTAQYWLGHIPAYPDGVEIVTGTPSAWTEMASLTVDKGLWHFLHWRTTATRIMDVFFSGDTKLTKEVSSMANTLWEQIREMAYLQIFARAGVNRHNQLFVQVDPLLIPTADRSSIPTVMTLQKGDWVGALEFDRVTIPEVSIVSLSGVAVNSSGVGSPFFSLAPGHTYPRLGTPESPDGLLVSGQTQANTLAGLYRARRNNELPDIPMNLLANNRLIECFPNQRCAVTIEAGDNIRGIAYDGYLYPTSVTRVFNPETGYMHTEVTFEGETFESLSVNGDIPGSGDRSTPPIPSLPPLPDFPPLLPGWPPDGEASRTVVLHDADTGGHNGIGVIYTTDFDTSSPTWQTMNSGLTSGQYRSINRMFITPSGVIYAAYEGQWERGADDGHFIARAPSVGGAWTVILTEADVEAAYPGDATSLRLGCSGCRLDVPETVLYCAGRSIPPFGDTSEIGIYLGVGGSFSQTATITNMRSINNAAASHNGSTWGLTYSTVVGISQSYRYHRYNTGATAETFVATIGGFSAEHIRAGISDVIYIPQDVLSTKFRFSDDDGTTWEVLPDSDDMTGGGRGLATDITGQYVMARWGAGNRGRSSDYGTTWSGIPNLSASSGYRWGYLGGVGTGTQWVAVNGAGTIIRYSSDYGESWLNREGNISSLLPAGGNVDIVVPVLEVSA